MSDFDDAERDHGHAPVMLAEVLRLLEPRPDETVVDCTLGRGGHAEALARAIGPSGRLIGFDLDEGNLEHARPRVEAAGGRFIAVHGSFAGVREYMAAQKLRADVVLADLGVSSTQLDDPSRGFSFAEEGPLDMRMDRTRGLLAADLVAGMSERELADLIFQLGEEPLARRIARKVALAREHEPIVSTAQLARLVVEAYGPRARSSRLHPATRTFMALRMAVNDEQGALRLLLEGIELAARRADDNGWLNGGARVAVISFHSLEDRLVKHAFAELARQGFAERLTKKPLTADEGEIQANPRSRSAKLRALRLISSRIDDAQPVE